jgi:hypothetical protein
MTFRAPHDRVAEPDEFALYPEVAPVAVLPGQAQDEVFERHRVGTHSFATGAELVNPRGRDGRPVWKGTVTAEQIVLGAAMDVDHSRELLSPSG